MTAVTAVTTKDLDVGFGPGVTAEEKIAELNTIIRRQAEALKTQMRHNQSLQRQRNNVMQAISGLTTWPEDAWQEAEMDGRPVDINVYLCEGERRITVYPVVVREDGTHRTDTAFSLIQVAIPLGAE